MSQSIATRELRINEEWNCFDNWWLFESNQEGHAWWGYEERKERQIPWMGMIGVAFSFSTLQEGKFCRILGSHRNKADLHKA
jgi:hypothetical protein